MKRQENVIIGEDEITLSDRVVPYTVKRSQRAKNVRLGVREEKGLEVVIPANYPLENIPDLLGQKESWILDKLDLMEKNSAQKKAAQTDAVSIIRYLGKEYRVVVILDHSAPIRVELKEDKAFFTLPQNREELLRQVMDAWYRWAAKSLFEERVRFWSERMHVSCNTVFVRNQKTRWGSCSRRQNLSLNMRIIMAPLEVVDYVVIHELAHLKEMNHSKKFWQAVEEFCPDYKRLRSWLKKYGPGLTM